jgi:hypothetical protein
MPLRKTAIAWNGSVCSFGEKKQVLHIGNIQSYSTLLETGIIDSFGKRVMRLELTTFSLGS